MKITFKHKVNNNQIVFNHSQSISSKHIKRYINLIYWIIDDWLNEDDYAPPCLLSFYEWIFKPEQEDLLCTLSQYQILLYCDRVHTEFDISIVSKGTYMGFNSLAEAETVWELAQSPEKLIKGRKGSKEFWAALDNE